MKNSTRITRVQLDVDHNDDYLLFGIVSTEPDYRLSLLINKKTKLSLKHSSPVEVPVSKGENISFSRFGDTSGHKGYSANLISNKSGGSVLVKKPAKIDFLLQVYNFGPDFEPEKLATVIKSIESVTAVFKLDKEEIKDRNLQYLIL